MELEDLANKLYDIDAIKFGNFTLKSGIWSPFYFDLRVIVSYPDILKQVSLCMLEKSKEVMNPYQRICGVPYTALPLATLICVENKVPMLVRRKEAKDYGTKKMIEGTYKEGEVCLIIEDVVSSGMSILETVESLKDIGVEVKDAVVMLDRQQNGRQYLAEKGIKMHSIFSISELVVIFLKSGRMSEDQAEKIKVFLQTVKEIAPKSKAESCGKATCGLVNGNGEAVVAKALSYKDRSDLVTHPCLKRLFTIMHNKKTNLCFSVDVTSPKRLLELADQVGPYICALKSHVDGLDVDEDDKDFSKFITSLKNLANKHDFLLFEDRKFADIGNTASQQFQAGVHKINQWADLVTAHPLPGPGVLSALNKVNKQTGCLLVAEMSSADNLITPEYTKEVVKMAQNHRDFVVGFISQQKLSLNPNFIHFTPGVHSASKGDSHGQQYNTPCDVVCKRGADVIIVGRGISQAADPLLAAKQYAQEGYAAYERLL